MKSLPPGKTGFIRFIMSFGYAIRGIVSIVIEQRNFRIHLFTAVIVVTAGFLCGLSLNEWCIIVFAIGLVLAMEAFNTVAEKLVDFISPEYHPMAGTIKDIAAGGVLITAIAALTAGLIIFIPKIT